MANSPLGLNTENPVTSSRIKYTHTHIERLPHVETLSNQNTRPPHPRRKGRRGPRAGAFLCLRPPAQRGLDVGQPENAPFCL